MEPIECPSCGISFIGKEIPQGLFSTGHYATMEDAEKAAAHYGWTRENKKTFTANCVYVKHFNKKTPNYYECKSCGHKF